MHAQHSSRDTRGHLPALVERSAAEPGPEFSGGKLLESAAPLYSIRIPTSPGRATCGLCGRRYVAAGPTGHVEDEPICDLCMLERDQQLGMVLALVAVTRSYGRGWPLDELEENNARLELMAFARIYETQAANYAPARPVDPDWLGPVVESLT